MKPFIHFKKDDFSYKQNYFFICKKITLFSAPLSKRHPKADQNRYSLSQKKFN